MLDGGEPVTAGIVYVTMFIQNGTGFTSDHKLDTNTRALTSYGITGHQLYVDGARQDVYLKTRINSGNSRVFSNNDGYLFSIDTATGHVLSPSTGPGCCNGNYDLALSKNQTRFGATY